MRTIEQNNGMIAEFMGVKFKDDNEYINELKEMCSNGIFFEQGYMASELKYHTSWDWLMTVVKKIYKMEIDTRDKCPLIDLRIGYTDIHEVYYAVVDFIEWYNENK